MQPQVVLPDNAAWLSANECPKIEQCGAALDAPVREPVNSPDVELLRGL
jgi:hypothetical protein